MKRPNGQRAQCHLEDALAELLIHPREGHCGVEGHAARLLLLKVDGRRSPAGMPPSWQYTLQRTKSLVALTPEKYLDQSECLARNGMRAC